MPPGIRHCLRCGHGLVLHAGRACPECGRAFDPEDPRTTAESPEAHATLRRLRSLTLGGTWILGILVVTAFLWLFLGGDAVLVLVLGMGPLLLSPILVLLALVPRNPVSRRRRALALVLPVCLLTLVAPFEPIFDWPLRLSFALHRAGLEARADALSAMSDQALRPRRERVGLLTFDRVHRRDGNLGFQISGNSGGGQFLVRARPNARFIWINTNWEIDLGDGWWFVYQD